MNLIPRLRISEMEAICDTVKGALAFLIRRGDSRDSECIKCYLELLRDRGDSVECLLEKLYTVKDRFHPEMNGRYVEDLEYKEKFLVPIQRVRVEAMLLAGRRS